MPVIFSDPRVRLSRREGGRSHSLEAGVLGLKATERHCLRFEIRLGRWQCAERRGGSIRLDLGGITACAMAPPPSSGS